MKVLNLQCAGEHVFEGWFGSEDDFIAQSESKDIACPICGSTVVIRLPSAPRLSVSRHAAPRDDASAERAATAQTAQTPHSRQMTMQSQWLRAVHHVLSTTEDVGERFAEEARRIHYGEVQERGIRGRASGEEAQALSEEGIQVMALPIPDALKGPLQ